MTHQLNDHFSEVKNGERFQFESPRVPWRPVGLSQATMAA